MAVAKCPVPVLEYEDDLSDVFKGRNLNLFSLLERYEKYLVRLKAEGQYPLDGRTGKIDKCLLRAVGYFHLYAWIRNVLSYHCIVNFEFPAENGVVNIHIKCSDRQGIIEIRRFKNPVETENACVQAADYAGRSGLEEAFIAMFVRTEDYDMLDKISGIRMVDGVRVRLFAFFDEISRY